MRQRKTAVNDSKKNPLLGEVSRLHRDGEGLTLTDTREPHHYRTPLFLWQLKAQRKSLAKRNAAKAFRRCDGEKACAAFTRAKPL